MNVGCVKIWYLFHIHDRKYRFIADLYVFVYGRAECASISLECTKVKLLTLDNIELMLLLFVFNDDIYNFKESNLEKQKIS